MGVRVGRRNDLDLMKGIAIIAVVLYHFGILESGYLGVDIFFVIAGFLTVPKVLKEIENKQFSYIKFIWGRVIRLLPAILLAAVICLGIGLFLWLPDDYENLAYSVIASTAFSNNILAAITTRNYWDSVNDFKPLMHTWYLGILMQFYVIFPLLTLAFKKIGTLTKGKHFEFLAYSVLTVLSVVLFIWPKFNQGDKFYLIPFRFYELMLGGLIGIKIKEIEQFTMKHSKWLAWVSFAAVLFLQLISLCTFDPSSIGVETVVIGQVAAAKTLFLPNSVLVLLTVLFTAIFICTSRKNKLLNSTNVISAIGKRSFSIFVWHQVLLALYRYSVSNKITIISTLVFFVALVVISELSYQIIERKIKVNWRSSLVVVVTAILICGFSGFLYLHAGVIRDVPELGIRKENVQRGMHAQYCDRVYRYDQDFPETEKTKVLVIGNSFARDFGNVLLESAYEEEISLSYSFEYKESLIERIKQADRIFVFGEKSSVPDYLWENVKSEDIVYGIGTKNFGSLTGQIYFNRFKADYFQQTIPIDPGYDLVNKQLAQQWGNHYINMFDAVMVDGRVRVFSDTNMFISQDTRHLTQAGAQYYAKNLDLEEILY